MTAVGRSLPECDATYGVRGSDGRMNSICGDNVGVFGRLGSFKERLCVMQAGFGVGNSAGMAPSSGPGGHAACRSRLRLPGVSAIPSARMAATSGLSLRTKRAKDLCVCSTS